MTEGWGPWRTTGLLAIASGTAVAAFLISARPLHESAPAPYPPASESVADAERAVMAASAEFEKPAPVSPAELDLVPPPATPPPPDADMAAPSLELVRIGARGDAVVAGAGAPGAEVVLRLDGDEVASALSDKAGEFVFFFDAPPSPIPRVLTLETRDAGGGLARARDSVIVAPAGATDPVPPAPPRAATAADTPTVEADGLATEQDDAGGAARDPAAEGAASAAVPSSVSDGVPLSTGGGATAPTPPAPGLALTAVATPGALDASAEPGADPAPNPPVAAPRLFRSGPDGVTVLSQPVPSPDIRETLGIDTITYDAAGDVALAGRGVRGTSIRVYLDNRPVALAQVGRDGVWAAPLADVETGIYTLRVDEVGADGTVAARIETPFERTAPAIAAAARRTGATAITVQPGFTLWAISKGYFGEGIRYVQIFEANRSLIRDPDLIFPGQVFALPDAGEPDAQERDAGE